MASLILKHQRGRPRFPRLEFQPAFLDCLRESARPGWWLALAGGWPHYPTFSEQLHQRTLAATPITVERFHRLADALGFPRADVFREAGR